jgi:pyrroline-5-carboxylate reductase
VASNPSQAEPGLPRVGVVGVGAIAEAVIDGLNAEGAPRAALLLSPRNAEVAARLAARYPAVQVAADNQAVLDGSDVVVLAVTPQVAEAVLADLAFAPRHRIVSLIATYEMARLRPLVRPAASVVRAAPVPAVARRLGGVILHPPSPEIAALFDGLGRLVQLDAEGDMDAFLAVTGLMGAYFGVLDETARWLAARVEDPAQVEAYVGAIFHGLGAAAEAEASRGFARLAQAHTTPGGLNEQAHRELRAAGWTGMIGAALDLVHARIQRRATLADGLSIRCTR